MIDDSPLHQSLEIALWSPLTCARGKEMRKKVCECSCWSQIVDVYTPMFQQWGMYDADVNKRLNLLQTMCTNNVVGAFTVNTVEETTTAQCGVNTITMRLRSSLALPAGAKITITGLNTRASEQTLDITSFPAALIATKADFTAAKCTQWCSQVGLCPSTGSAVSDGCLAIPTEASGFVTSNRCMQWCEDNAVITVTVAQEAAANTEFTFSFNMLNPSMSQQPAVVAVSASAAGLYIPPSISSPRPVGKAGVLAASTSPRFDTFTVTELPCPGSFDASSQMWKGSCAGMMNTLTVSMKPNIQLLSGARITLSGLTRCEQLCPKDLLWQPPSVLAGFLQTDSWDSPSGTLVLRVASTMNAGDVASFTMDFQMPQFPDPSGDKQPVKISASRGGPELSCDFLETTSATSVLIAKMLAPFSFITKKVTPTRCSPGLCNEISLDISVNQALAQSQGEVIINVTGFQGMVRDLQCMRDGGQRECNDDGESIMLYDKRGLDQGTPYMQLVSPCLVSSLCQGYLNFCNITALVQLDC